MAVIKYFTKGGALTFQEMDGNLDELISLMERLGQSAAGSDRILIGGAADDGSSLIQANGKITAKDMIQVNSTGGTNALLRAAATGTGMAGFYFDAANGDFSGSDFCSLVQLDDLSLELNNYGANPIRLKNGGISRMIIHPSGRITVAGDSDDGINQFQVGGTVAAVGLKLNSSTSGDPNTLDYYQEGTFTPIVEGVTSPGVGTYVSQSGKYTRVGNMVNFSLKVEWSAHTGTGFMKVGGLPFSNVLGFPTNVATASSNLTYANQLEGLIGSGSNAITLYTCGSGASIGSVSMDTAGVLYISGNYFV